MDTWTVSSILSHQSRGNKDMLLREVAIGGDSRRLLKANARAPLSSSLPWCRQRTEIWVWPVSQLGTLPNSEEAVNFSVLSPVKDLRH